MGQRQLIITNNSVEYIGHVATIRKTTFGVEDHGILSCMVMTEWSGGGQGFGGYSLDDKPTPDTKGRVPTAYGLDHLVQIIQTVGSGDWEHLVGSKVIILHAKDNPYGEILGIAHLTDEERIFIPKEHYELWKDRKN